jgi:hypothetical protein
LRKTSISDKPRHTKTGQDTTRQEQKQKHEHEHEEKREQDKRQQQQQQVSCSMIISVDTRHIEDVENRIRLTGSAKIFTNNILQIGGQRVMQDLFVFLPTIGPNMNSAIFNGHSSGYSIRYLE